MFYSNQRIVTCLPNLDGQKDSTRMLMAFFAFSNWSLGMLPEESSTNTRSLFASCLDSSARFPKSLPQLLLEMPPLVAMDEIPLVMVGLPKIELPDCPRQASSNDWLCATAMRYNTAIQNTYIYIFK